MDNYQHIFEHAPIGILSTDEKGSIRQSNPKALALCGGGESREVVGRPLWEVLGYGAERVRLALFGDTPHQGEYREQCRFDTCFGVELKCGIVAESISDPSGDSGGYIVYLTDPLEKTAVFQEMVQAEKIISLSKIFGGVAHELNNPLTGIMGYSQLMLGLSPDEPLRKRLESISAEAQRCKKIVQSLMSFSASDGEGKVPMHVNAILRESLALCDYQMEVDDIALSVNVDESLPKVPVAAQAIKRVFLSVIHNAHQALQEVKGRDRRLVVCTGSNDSSMLIRFEDNGIGMTKEHRNQIFEPFFTTKGIGTGVGLGLSISYGVMRDHGGAIDVESAPGEGTTITVVLPLSGNPVKEPG